MSDPQQQVDQVLEDAKLFDYTQEVRKQVIEKVRSHMTNPDALPDAKDVSNLLKAADGIDKQIMGRSRLKLEEKQSENMSAQHDLISALLMKIPSTKVFEIDPALSGRREIPQLPEDIHTPSTVDGEMDIGTSTLNHEQFMKSRGEP